MTVSFFWGGFKVYVDPSQVLNLISAIGQGAAAIQSFLNQNGYGWLSPLVSVLVSWGAETVRRIAASCGGRTVVFTIPWTVWMANQSCA